MSTLSFEKNNFDLIRLFAATQVAVCHSAEMLAPAVADTWFINLLRLFPGVPIFFFISGFLISRSFERSSSLQSYTRNRVLRIYPALHACLLLNLIAVWSTGYFADVGASLQDVSLLYLAKSTVLQFYNPEFMRGFGDGVLNGSLWTICVELQFYVLVPLAYFLFLGGKTRKATWLLLFLVVGSFACNRLLYLLQNGYAENVYWKLFRVSFLPWFYMFLLGVLVQRNFHWVQRYFDRVSFPVALVAYVIYAGLMQHFGSRFDNGVGLAITLPLFVLVLLAAYTKPHLADSILRKNDVSYGMYIYHMPVVNMALYYGYENSPLALTVVLILSVLLAWASWVLVERPSLRRKKASLHSVGKADKQPAA